MKNVCFLAPAILGNNGFSTHITEVWKKMPKKLNAEIHIVIIEGKRDKRISNVKNLKIIELPFFIRKIKFLFIKLILFQFYALFYCLLLDDLKLIYSRYGTMNIADVLISKIKKIPLITEVNGIYKHEKEKTKFNRLKIFISEITAKILFQTADRIITVSDGLKKSLNNEYGIPCEKIEVIENGADPKLFRPMDKNICRKKLNISPDSKIVCFIGNLAIWQGVEYLIESAPEVIKELPNTNFLIVGGGELEQKLKAKAKKLRIRNKIIFTDRIPYTRIPIYINSSDICIHLMKKSKTSHSPVKLYEYMSCGKPIIGSNIPDLSIVNKYNTGILVNPKKSQEVAKAIIKLLKNKKLRKQMGRNGRKIVLEKYTWEINVKKISNICKEFI